MLSSFLLSSQGKQKKVDEGLDAIFTTSAKAVITPTSIFAPTLTAPISGKKRKRNTVLKATGRAEVEEQAASAVEPVTKRKKTEKDIGDTRSNEHSSDKRKERNDTAAPVGHGNLSELKKEKGRRENKETTDKQIKRDRKEKEQTNKKEKLKSTKRSKTDSEEDEGQAMKDLEERYLRQKLDASPSKAKGRKHGEKGAIQVITDKDSEHSEDSEGPGASEDLQRKGSSPHSEDEAESDGEDMDPEALVHETISSTRPGKPQRKKKAHYVPEGETKEQRDERTVFVGNLPLDILKSKSAQKALKRHLLSFRSSLSSKEHAIQIETIRFRSVAFKKPTNLLELKEGRKQDRASAWKNNPLNEEANSNSVPDSNATPSKSYLTPAEKKRIAFIKGEFHEAGASANAYVVIAHPDLHPDASVHGTSSSSTTTKGLDTLKKKPDQTETTYDPYIAAGWLVDKMDGSQFMGRTLRLDRVGRPRRTDLNSGSGIVLERDPAATIFVGNLDFEAKEEDVRAFFETLLTVEIGPPRTKVSKNGEDTDSGGDKEDNASGDEEESDGSRPSQRKGDRKSEAQDQGTDNEDDDDASRGNHENKMDIDSESKTRWVHSVRIIRDKDTQLGKGFAYVRFSERTCADEILAMGPDKLKFAKRKLRVQRCKANPTSSKPSNSVAETGSAKGKSTFSKGDKPYKPHKGDPLLGERIKSLSKDERKEVKKQDANRLARRMEKKAKKRTLDPASRSGKMKEIKERMRVRKTKSALPFKARSQQGFKGGKGGKSEKRS